MYSEYPKVYVVTKVRSYQLQVLGYRVQVPGRCWSQVLGRQAAGAGQVLDRCWGHRSQVPGRQAAGAGQVLGRCWTGAGDTGRRCRADRLQVPGRCWAGAAGAAGAGQTGLRSGTQAQRSRVLAL